MLQPPSITIIFYNGNHHFDLQNISRTQIEGFRIQILTQARLLKSCSAHALIWSLISWHIGDLHNRFSMCSTKPENDLKPIRHPGHMNGSGVLSSESKGGFVRVATIEG